MKWLLTVLERQAVTFFQKGNSNQIVFSSCCPSVYFEGFGQTL